MFDKIFNKKIIVPFFSGIGTVAIFQWIVFPGLTAADTIINILAGIIGFFTLVYAYYLIGLDKLFTSYTESGGLVDMQELKEAEQMFKEKQTAKPKRKSTKSKTTKTNGRV
jgi:hypothetical protein